MGTRRPTSAVSTILLVSALVLGTSPAALAAKKPTVSLTLPAQADERTAIPYSFTSADVRKKDKLVIQRQMGTDHVFRTVKVLPHNTDGTGSLPGLELGHYRFRIAVIHKQDKKRLVLAKQRATIAVFGKVPLLKLLPDHARRATYTAPTFTFPYVLHTVARSATGDTALTVGPAHNHCRSIHFDFVPELDSGYNDGDSVSVTVVQQSLDPVSGTGPVDQITSFDAPLRPGESWSLRSSLATGDQSTRVDLNGYASCDSLEPAD